MINGGRKKWLEEKRALTTEAAKVAATTYTASGPDDSIRARKDEVLGSVERRSRASRGRAVGRRIHGENHRASGNDGDGATRGHIPGAANIPWAQAAAEDGTFKSADALQRFTAGKG